MDFIDQLKYKLKLPLPGWKCQSSMAPIGRLDLMNQVTEYRKAGVLSLLYPKHNEWHMVFIQRAVHDKDIHSAQISFPGGSVETQDKTMTDTALREAYEEIGLDISKVNILAELTPLKIPVSQFEVFPVLAYSESELNFKRQESEVDQIIEVPINTIINPEKRESRSIALSNGTLIKDVPVFNYNNNIIWGATSMMLNEIIEILA